MAEVFQILRPEDYQEVRNCWWHTWLIETWPVGDLKWVLTELNNLSVVELVVEAHRAFELTGFDAASRIEQRCWLSQTYCRWRVSLCSAGGSEADDAE